MNEQTAIAIVPSAMPMLSMTQAKSRRDDMIAFVRTIMVSGSDYGVIPGTSAKPTLLKPGAEKLATFFGLRPTFSEVRVIEDWTGKDHGGAPFFYYWFRCHLLKGNEIIAEGDGSCNSHESKYRYRKAERTCPRCGKANIRKGKDNWYCWKKTDGCGATFDFGDKAIESQQVGRVENPDMADQANTILKMAQKRALVAAVLIGVNASEFFTQDVEDMEDYIEGEYHSEPPSLTQAQPARQNSTPRQPTPTEVQQRQTQPPARQPEPHTSEAPRLARIIGNPGFPTYAAPFVKDFPHYANKQGVFDTEHIQARAFQLGFAVIDVSNIAAVFAKLREYATEQAALPEA